MRKTLIFIILALFLIGCSPKESTNQITGNVVLDTNTVSGETTCQDSDNGIETETAGKVTSNGETLYDKCAGKTNILIEYYCENNQPVNQNLRCTTKKGCLAGACR